MTELLCQDHPHVQHVEQSSGDLRLFVGKNIFKPAYFTIVKHNHFTYSGFTIHLFVLGESHAVTIQYDDNRLDEICACTDVKLEGVKHRKLSSLGDCKQVKEKLHPFEYLFEKVRLNKDQVVETYRYFKEIQPEQNSHMLEYEFCSNGLHYDIKPKTTVLVTVSHKNVVIRTVHTYPDEEKVGVYTKSAIKIL